MSINNGPYHQLRNQEVRGFFKRIIISLAVNFGENSEITKDFRDSFAKYEDALGVNKPEMGTVAKADSQADSIYMGATYMLKAQANHPSEAIREAAQVVQNVFDQYPNPTAMSYNQEYGILDTLLSKLDQIDATILAECGMDNWVTYLHEAVDHVRAAMQTDTEITTSRALGVTKQARLTLINSWNTLKKHLEVMDEVFHDQNAIDAIAQLNQIIEKARVSVAQRLSRGSKADKEPDINFDI